MSLPACFSAISLLMQNSKMSLSIIVARPTPDGTMRIRLPCPDVYSSSRMSGFTDSENTGCSIDAMSSLGLASAISMMKKSRFGCRSGSNLLILADCDRRDVEVASEPRLADACALAHGLNFRWREIRNIAETDIREMSQRVLVYGAGREQFVRSLVDRRERFCFGSGLGDLRHLRQPRATTARLPTPFRVETAGQAQICQVAVNEKTIRLWDCPMMNSRTGQMVSSTTARRAD